MLLLVRVTLYITAAVTVSGNPHIQLLMTIALIVGLLFLKQIHGNSLYTEWSADCVETTMYLNLLLFAASVLYCRFKVDITLQTVAAHLSTIATFLLLVGVIVYHKICPLVKRKFPLPTDPEQNELNEEIVGPVEPAYPPKVTFSSF